MYCLRCTVTFHVSGKKPDASKRLLLGRVLRGHVLISDKKSSLIHPQLTLIQGMWQGAGIDLHICKDLSSARSAEAPPDSAALGGRCYSAAQPSV